MQTIFLIIIPLITGLVFIPTAGASEDISKIETQEKLVSLKGVNSEVIIGDKISLSGQVDSSLYGTNPSDVIVLISSPEGSHSDSFMLAKTSPNGTFNYNQVADVGGDWIFEALYSGIYSDKAIITVIPGNEPKKTALTLSGWPTFPKTGDQVTFKGRLTDSEGKGIAQKTMSYRLASSPIGCIGGCAFGSTMEWRDAGTVESDINGEYSFSLPVVERGAVQIETVFPGDDGYSPSSSRTLKITVYE